MMMEPISDNDRSIVVVSDDAERSLALSNISKGKIKLTDAQRANVEKKRQKALLLRKAHETTQSYPEEVSGNSVSKILKTTDTCGGFLLEEESEGLPSTSVIHPPGAIIAGDSEICIECGKPFLESYLLEVFGEAVCTTCRDTKEKHRLITKTEAKERYMLSDIDLEKREPILRFISRKNPRNSRWGDMKLFLEMQVARRAAEVWGTDEKLEEERQHRHLNRERLKKKKYDKKIKELRMTVRSSLYKKNVKQHQHNFGIETLDNSGTTYSKTCVECGYVTVYEKM